MYEPVYSMNSALYVEQAEYYTKKIYKTYR